MPHRDLQIYQGADSYRASQVGAGQHDSTGGLIKYAINGYLAEGAIGVIRVVVGQVMYL